MRRLPLHPMHGRHGLGWLALGLLVVSTLGGCMKVPEFDEGMVLGGEQVSAEVLNRGARTYVMRCASCHGYDGDGNGPGGRALKEPPTNFKAAEFRYTSTEGELPTDADMDRIIVRGSTDNGMPAWPGMKKSDRHAVIQYIKTLSPVWTGPAKTAKQDSP